MATDVQNRWIEQFPDCPPLRPLLRKTCSDRWLRIHSLPAAKRLPVGANDEQEVLRRHAAVAERVLQTHSECALVLAYANGYQGQDEPPSVQAFKPTIARKWSERWSSDLHFSDDLEGLVFAISSFTYAPAGLASLVLDVACGRTAPLLVFSLVTGCVYSPYDGGADLFFGSADARDNARNALSEWCSERPDGL